MKWIENMIMCGFLSVLHSTNGLKESEFQLEFAALVFQSH